ncbi:LD-carboxypeptidase [Planococcus sp. N028]|uniref:LD-carboxypeptidase n=1 Tax=Planococcus shixiaomingii TaxID=3058393 RepID=A0ABT8N6N2_9BACL|nr:S66 peptidase family protein [Planococcus sp. N028]MDN7243550.1 LD-carboxypeptidase [Planococcus sp. N028]
MPIQYPKPLQQGDLIGVTAPSSGVENSLHVLLSKAKEQVEAKGYSVVIGETAWTQKKGRSGEKEQRAKELMDFLEDDRITAIIPPWGGSFSMEILPLLDWEKLKSIPPKWILGYSDISTFLFVYTTITGNASAHGTSFTELSAPEWDMVTSKWTEVLETPKGGVVIQHSSDSYQSSWDQVYKNPATGFYFDSKTEWRNLNGQTKAEFSGRLLGGCLSTLRVLIGTPYDQVNDYISTYAEEGVVWYLESVGLDAANIYRSLWQMKQAGWFKHANGILIGRASRYTDNNDFTLEDALVDSFAEDGIPVLYNVDIGHAPPQNVLVNGAYSRVVYNDSKGSIEMNFI